MRALLRRDTAVVAFLAWTTLVWLSRIRNVVGNDELDGAGKAFRLLVVVVFLGLAAAVVARWRRPSRRTWLTVLAGWTVGLWTVQMVAILLDDYGIGFVVIHAVLAAVSIALAVLAWRAERRAATTTLVGATL